MIDKLSHKILKAMPKVGSISASQITKALNENEDSVRRLLEELKGFGYIVESTKKESEGFSLSSIGKNYIDSEFEHEIIAKCAPVSLSDLNAKLGVKAGQVISICKRLGLINIENGIIKLIDNNTKVYDDYRRILTEASKSNIAVESVSSKDLEIIRVMIKQGYISSVRKTDISYSLTGKGQKIALEEITYKELANNLTPEMLKLGSWKNTEFKPYNVESMPSVAIAGKYQPYKRFLDLIRKKLIAMGFEEMPTNLTTTEFYNFDVLYQPQNHSARTWTDTYSLKIPNVGSLPQKDLVQRIKDAHEKGGVSGSTGWKYNWDENIAKRLMPAAHGTAFSAKKMSEGIKVPGRYFAISRVYRPDVLDATHLNEFNQLEGFVVADDISFEHLLGMLKTFAEEIAGAKETMFYPDYYPFTEPSVQLSAKHPKLGWVEFGGAGIFRPEITKTLGINQRVMAWGLGIDRLAMFNLGINDIRDLFSNKLDWLREKEIVEKI